MENGVRKSALGTWAIVLIASCGCGSEPPAVKKEIPPTPTAEDFQGGTTPAPLTEDPSSSSGQD
jgi:hypothetical protein